MSVDIRKIDVFDIDGTLADCNWRRHLVEGNERNWDEFFRLSIKDTPRPPLVALYKTLQGTGHFDMYIVSGRPELFRKLTNRWLESNGITYNELFMRRENDRRPDTLVKEDILNMIKAKRREILFAVDDRSSVVQMWRRNGITCLQADIGDF